MFLTRLESPTRQLEIQASDNVFIQSRAGSIEASSLNEIKLRARNVSLQLLILTRNVFKKIPV